MRRSLDYLFKFSAGLAAIFLVAIALLILASSLGRFVGIAVHDANELAGFSLAAGTFLALGPALRAGTHIRVLIVLSHLKAVCAGGSRASRWRWQVFLAGISPIGWPCWPRKVFPMAIRRPVFWPFHCGSRKRDGVRVDVFTIAMLEALFDVARGRAPVFATRETSELTE
ncbi:MULTISPECIES: TRAP transporter small permease [Thalassospira]|uniref:TRAP transporter small permease n=1 Tax=Thalassospira TaxID=168934 RepID=UPI000827987F|nr:MULTISPECIES: TRAP transporter small permease [Thalassospira]OCK10285.1 Tripartite ATP-independent periplasmic transporter DctQ component [Thalassospira sp. KO164]SEE91681.1 hypothetical protein SAMN04515623_4525 [Thalassospira permensis]